MKKDVLIQEFKHNFIDRTDDRKIVIYGIGEWTKRILDAFPQAEILGLMDGYLTEGNIYGRSILTKEKLIHEKVKIVVAARGGSQEIICKRIAGFCNQHQIPVLNIYGELLNGENPQYGECEEWGTEFLYEELCKFDYISFDIFDTLLIRKTLFREAVYYFIQKEKQLSFDFIGSRLQCEKMLAKKGEEPTIFQIYQYMKEKENLNDSEIEQIRQLEIAFETDNFVPRREILNLYNRLRKAGKKLYLITDMYFSKEILEIILDKNGISQYEELFISCELGANKEKGLYRYYNERVSGGKKAHIGDSKESDGVYAEDNGLASFVIPSIINVIAQQKSRKFLMNYHGDIPELIRTLAFSRLFDTKQFGINKIYIQSGYQLGFGLLAPMLYGWAEWIYEKSLEKGIEKLFFFQETAIY